MAQPTELKATARARAGKGAARAVRREGKVPGVIYGDGMPAQPIAMVYKDIWLQTQKSNFLSTIFELDVEGSKTRVIPRDVQLDVVRDLPIHVDFQRVGKGSRLRVGVPVKFANEAASPGLKRGGVLNIVRRTVEFYCPPDAIPEFITVDLTGTDIGHSVHISAVKLPEGVTPVIRDRDFTVATIAGAVVEKEPETATTAVAAEGAAGAEGAAAAGAEGAKPGESAKAGGKDEKAAPAKDDKKK